MNLTDQDIQEFIEAYRKDFGEDLTFPEAREMAFRLLFLAEQLMKPTPSELAAAGITSVEIPEDDYLHEDEDPLPLSRGGATPAL